jgi:pimeloyl-ACP methyl ester carboxylesterase
MNDASYQPLGVSVRGGQISYIEAGDGPALVFLHGIGSAAASWRRQIAAFAPRFRAIAWNAPGYDASTPPDKAVPTASDYAKPLADFLDALHVERCHLVGHSLGTLMAARFAVEFGSRLHSLTLCAPAIGGGPLSADRRVAMLEDRLNDLATLGPRGMAEKRGPRLLGPKATPEMVREVVEIQAAAVRPEGYARAAQMLSTADILQDVARISPELPVQFVYGEDDRITPPAACRNVAEACPGAAAHAIAGAGHAPYVERPERLNEIIGAFLDAHIR